MPLGIQYVSCCQLSYLFPWFVQDKIQTFTDIIAIEWTLSDIVTNEKRKLCVSHFDVECYLCVNFSKPLFIAEEGNCTEFMTGDIDATPAVQMSCVIN